MFVTDADLYLAGRVGGRAVYWKNGERHQLEATVESAATAIYASGSDVYVAGTRGGGTATRPVMWKNGELQGDLSDKRGEDAWVPSGIYVKGPDITVVGETKPLFGDGKLYVWKNGVEKNAMPDLKEKVTGTNARGQRVESTVNLQTTSMHIKLSDGDVYVGGLVRQNTMPYNFRAWKNDRPITLASPKFELRGMFNEDKMFNEHKSGLNTYTAENYAISFHVSGNTVIFYTDVYIWKNGTLLKLETFEDPRTLQQIPFKIHSVFASKDDVFAIGRIIENPAFDDASKFVLWKNGKASILNNKSGIIRSYFEPTKFIIKD